MGKYEDMTFLVQIMECGSLSAAGKHLSLSNSAMSMRLKTLEDRYKTRIFNRTTRSLSLTRAGEDFYHCAIRVISEVQNAESILLKKDIISGRLRISAPSDFGRQYLSIAIRKFNEIYPSIIISLFLTDTIIDLITNRLDVSIRYGNLPDCNLIRRVIKPNHRVLVASPDYIRTYGAPSNPEELFNHHCIILEQHGNLKNEWRFEGKDKPFILRIRPSLICNDGHLLREWAVRGVGIACKSWLDVKNDVEEQRLKIIMPDTFLGYSRSDDKEVGLQFIFPHNIFQPEHVIAFCDFFMEWMNATTKRSQLGG